MTSNNITCHISDKCSDLIKEKNLLEVSKYAWRVDVDDMLDQERVSLNDLHFCDPNLLGEIQVLNKFGSQTFYMYKKLSFGKITLLHLPFSVILNHDNSVTLEYVNSVTDLQENKKKSNNIEHILSKRIDDIKALDIENTKLLARSQSDLCSESEEKQIDDDISLNRCIIKQHKSFIRENESYDFEVLYANIRNYLRYNLVANHNYIFGDERVTWVPCTVVVECKPMLDTIISFKYAKCRVDKVVQKECEDILGKF